jgi:hypothetical protein
MQKPNEKMRRIILLLVTWGVLLGFFIGYENYFVSGQKEYLIDREFRNLDRLSVQLSAEFDRARLSVASLAKIMRSFGKAPQGAERETNCHGTEQSGRCFEAIEYSKTYLGGIWDEKNPSLSFLACLGENPDTIGLEQEQSPSQLVVFVQCPPSAEPETRPTRIKREPETFLRMDLKPWVLDAFAKYKNSFEDVLVADESGHVLFQQSENGPRISELSPIIAKGTDISAKEKVFGFLGSSNPPVPAAATPTEAKAPEGGASSTPSKSGVRSKPAVKQLDRLLQGSTATKVSIGGKDYFLFAEPSRVVLGNTFGESGQRNLILVGLRLASSVEAESHAMPYSVLIWLALGGVVLLGFSWPWFKLQYMSNTERFRPRDGWLLLFTLLLVTAGVMLMLLNVSYLKRMTSRADKELQSIAEQMKVNFDQEITDARSELELISNSEEFKEVSKADKGYTAKGNYYIKNVAEHPYPYFEIAFWGDARADQVAKLDIRKVPTPAVNLGHFPFYKAVQAEMNWSGSSDEKKHQDCLTLSASGDPLSCTFFQPVLSPNTNEFAPVLAAPFSHKSKETTGEARLKVQALVFRPMTIIDPVLPPGYAFAILDSKCMVLFHSDSFRDMRENFCEESKNKSELGPWLFSGASTPLDITYGGKGRRAYLTNFPLPGLSAGQATYLIVFQEGDQQLTFDLAVILVCSIFLGFYFSFLGVAAFVHLKLRTPFHWDYAPRFVWPCRESAAAYLQVFGLSVLVCALYLHFYHGVHEAPLLALTLCAVVLSVAFAAIRLSSSWGVLSFGIAVSFAAVLAWLATWLIHASMGVNISQGRMENLMEWTKLPYLPLGVGIFAALVSAPFDWYANKLGLSETLIERFRKRIMDRSKTLYSLAAVSLIVCVSILPCAGVFKYAYDVVSEISLKHDEAVFAERLIARKNRIADYYKPLNGYKVAVRRLSEKLDRYDQYSQDGDGHAIKPNFNTCNEPAFEGHPDKPNCPANPGRARVEYGLNDVVEKAIAGATLTFPTNELGSEISRLGVAETDKSRSWERYWLEPNATTFTLLWNDKSRAPAFNVWGQYPEWQGLAGQPRYFLLAFLAFLMLWLISLTKKIFLTSVESASAIEIVSWRTVSAIKRDTLVIGLPRSGKSAYLKNLRGLDARDFRDLRDLQTVRSGTSKYYELDNTDCYSGIIIIDQFDFNMRDPVWNQKRLELIEKLLSKKDQKLVIVSTVDPLYFLTAEGPKVLGNDANPAEVSALLERWARVLDNFSRVKLPNEVEDEFAEEVLKFREQSDQSERIAKWICHECTYTPMLQKIGLDLFEKYQPVLTHPDFMLPTRQQLVEWVAARADAYYRTLWAGLTSNERLVLYQLALDGWANPRNAEAIHQLEQKQLIFRRPMYRIINDSFRSFIRCSEHESEIVEWQRTEQRSTWQALRFVVFAALIGIGVWLLYAQAQLFQTGAGYITAIATLLTAIAGFAARTKRPTSSATSEPTPPA